VYPGVRCDIPSHCYQATFEPHTRWTQEYAEGSEIRDYWHSVAKKYDVYSKVRFKTKVTAACWDEEKAKWRLSTTSVDPDTSEEHDFDYLITAIGRFNAWKLPDYPGIESYKGVIRHSSNWDPAFDPAGKRIATIGNGASGIQITTALQKVASHVDHYARNKTWIAGSLNSAMKERLDVAMPVSEEQLKEHEDPVKYLAYRKKLEGTFFRNFEAMMRDSEITSNSRQRFTELMQKRLADKPELLEKMIPNFPPFCRRLTPGPGYLEAITKPNVDFIQTPIERFTETGIVTKDGVHREVDAVICSTGANVDVAPPFPIVSGE
jgi:cation diffusion facilitator CzcD-associated flavoprotein CzcO